MSHRPCVPIVPTRPYPMDFDGDGDLDLLAEGYLDFGSGLEDTAIFVKH